MSRATRAEIQAAEFVLVYARLVEVAGNLTRTQEATRKLEPIRIDGYDGDAVELLATGLGHGLDYLRKLFVIADAIRLRLDAMPATEPPIDFDTEFFGVDKQPESN